MEILVIGASGQLGSCLKELASVRTLENISFPDESAANILDIAMLEELFRNDQPKYVINCAAYTAVDKAEDDVDVCRLVNRQGALNLAVLCKKYGSALIHVSTDFVFEGNLPFLLTEDDAAAPINVYGLTKLEGEEEVIKILPKHFILRTSWLYSEYGNNFVKTMLRLGADREELSVIADQIGTPTYAIDLAGAILDIIASGKSEYGVYHYSNEGVTSWYDFAVSIFNISANPIKVLPILTSAYPTRAVRPKFTVMDKSKVKRTFDLQIPYWRDSLEVCVKNLALKTENV
jgi:dTDP-4-dehydrorhamnose reductase